MNRSTGMGGDAKPTVLIVEDERNLADTFARWLADDYEVRTVYTGEDALSAMDDSVDVVLLDRRLPDITGGEVLSAFRARGHDCRVCMVTAVDPDFDILEMRFDDYVVKPVLMDDLRGIVERLLERSTFDDRIRESFSLASKLSALESEKSVPELRENDDYLQTKARLDALREEIDDAAAEFDAKDFATAYRELDGS